MMYQPVDYRITTASPVDQAFAGYVQGASVAQNMQQKQMLQQQQQAQMQQEQVMQQRSMEWAKDLEAVAANPMSTGFDYGKLILKYPEKEKSITSGMNLMTPAQQESSRNTALSIYTAMETGSPEVAAKIAEREAEGYKNSGKPETAASLYSLAEQIRRDPTKAKGPVGVLLSKTMGADNFSRALEQIRTTRTTEQTLPIELRTKEAEASKTEADARRAQVEAANAPQRTVLDNANLQGQIEERAARLNLDKDKLESDVKMSLAKLDPSLNLSPEAQTLINTSAADAAAASQLSDRTYNLANGFEKLKPTAGWAGSAWSLYKNATGSQDAVTALKADYLRIRNSSIIQDLKGSGKVTDADMEYALKGFLPENAKPKQLASFLRGFAKLQQYSAMAHDAKAQWAGQVGSLSSPKKDITVLGEKVIAGASFSDFSRKIIKRKIADFDSKKQLENAAASGRKYIEYGQ